MPCTGKGQFGGLSQGGRFGDWMMASAPMFRRGSWVNSDGRRSGVWRGAVPGSSSNAGFFSAGRNWAGRKSGTEDNGRNEYYGDLAVIEGGGGRDNRLRELTDDSVINLNGKSLKLGDLIKGNYLDKGRKDFEIGIGAQTDMSGSVGLGGLGGCNGGEKGILMLDNNNRGLELGEPVGRKACVLGLEKVINKESGGQSMEVGLEVLKGSGLDGSTEQEDGLGLREVPIINEGVALLRDGSPSIVFRAGLGKGELESKYKGGGAIDKPMRGRGRGRPKKLGVQETALTLGKQKTDEIGLGEKGKADAVEEGSRGKRHESISGSSMVVEAASPKWPPPQP